MIRALFFDLDGTLFDRAAAHRAYCEDFLDRYGSALDPDIRSATVHVLSHLALGPGGDRHRFAPYLSSATRGAGPSPREVAEDYAARMPRFLLPDPAVLRLLEALSGRFRLAVISNGPGPLQRAKLARAGLDGRFERIFISGEQGLRKPDARLFRRALEWAGCAPAEALMIGDHPAEDIAGARAAGLTTCWVRHAASDPAVDPGPDWVVGHVTDLVGLLL